VFKVLRLLFVVAVPLGAATALPTPNGSAQSPGLATALAGAKPCAVDHAGAATDADIEKFIACYQKNNEQARQLIAPYSADSSSLLDELAAAQGQLKRLVGRTP
jgi:hypothetical protein